MSAYDRVGAGTGLVAALLFVAAFVVGLVNTDPPDLTANAAEWFSYVEGELDQLRIITLLNSLAIVLFFWFLGSVYAAVRSAEEGAGRLAAITLVGGAVGGAALFLGQISVGIALLDPELLTEDLTRLLFQADAMYIGLGGAAFTVFFAAVAAASFRFGALPKALAWLSAILAVLAAIGFVSVFTNDGIFAADGALGFWTRFAALVIWLAVTSIVIGSGSGKSSSARRR